MQDEAAFNTLSFFLELLLFTGMVGTALAVRFGRKPKGTDSLAAATTPGATAGLAPAAEPKTWSGEMTPGELAERRRRMMNVAYTFGVVVVSALVAVTVYICRRHGR